MAPDSKVQCRTCKRSADVSFGACLAKGWPKCCGATMELITQPSRKTIDAAVGNIFAPARALRKAGEGGR